MDEQNSEQSLPTLMTGENGRSVWIEHGWPTELRGGMLLSPRISCTSLRLRKSEPGYQTDWHVAGDPTLIVVRQGTLRIVLQDGTSRDFSPGEAFIAADKLAEGIDLDPTLNGHRAEVVGEMTLEAVHIKLTGVLG